MGATQSIISYGSYNKKFSLALTEPLSFVDNWYNGAALNIVGAAGGADQAILKRSTSWTVLDNL